MERRRDPLTGEWRTFATHRQDRTFLPDRDACPLCERAGDDVVVFDNDFPSFVADPPAPSVAGTDLYAVAPAAGAAEVIVYSDRHDATMADLGRERIERIVDVWAERYDALARRHEVAYVFEFENRGEAVGVTLHHPHGQVYGYPEIPPMVRRQLDVARQAGRCLTCDVVESETAAVRVVAGNDAFLAHVPFAARFPYEVHLVARRHVASIVELAAAERGDLAEVLEVVVRAYDRLFGFVLPYVLSIHQAPTDGGDWSSLAHLRLELTPLHRSADRLKFLAGSELHAGAYINDVAPEDAAAALR